MQIIKKHFNWNLNISVKAFPAICLGFLFFFAACKKETTDSEVHFELEGNSAILKAPIEGTSQTYQVKSDGLWLIDVIDGGDWIQVEPKEGTGNGSFTVTIHKNRAKEQRLSTLIFKAGFKHQSDLLKIEQEGNPNPPYFEITGNPEKFEVTGKGGSKDYDVQSNTHWKIELQNPADWVKIVPAEGNGMGAFKIVVEPNPAYTLRSAKLAFTVDDQKQTNSFEVIQEGKVDETVILNEDFNWLPYGSEIFYTTTGETRIDSWTEEEKAKGWTSTINPVSGSGNQPLVYARKGFVKLGKTSYGGDLISPKLSAISGTKDLIVSFKAVPYQTSGGTRDGNILMVGVVGPGSVSIDKFTINNWPDYTADPECIEIWKAPETTRSFVVTGATAETQIRFLGQDFDLRAPVDPNKNRIFLDDIIVIVK